MKKQLTVFLMTLGALLLAPRNSLAQPPAYVRADILERTDTGSTINVNVNGDNGSTLLGVLGTSTPAVNQIGVFQDSVGGIASTPDTINPISGLFTLPEFLMHAMATPAVSAAGTGTFYFDTATQLFMVSQNGAPYTAIATAVSAVSAVTATSPLFSSGGTTPNITCQNASGSQNGCLLSTDWTNFESAYTATSNASVPATPSTLVQRDGSGNVFGTTFYGGGVDSATAGGTVSVGAVNADFVNIGNPAATVNIQGTANTINSTNLDVTNQIINLNTGGPAGSGAGSGIDIQEASIVTGYEVISSDRNSWTFKAPNTAGIASITPGASGITLNQSSHNPVTLGTANGLSLATQVLSLGLSSTSTTGALDSTDWNTFNNAASLTSTATSLDTPNTLVLRDGSGNFAAGTPTFIDLNLTNLTQYSIPYIGASGLITQDATNFTYDPTAYNSGPNWQLGPEGSSLDDATFEVYNATAAQYTAHFHNTGTQGSAINNGALVALLDEPSGQVVTAGNQLGCLLFGGSRTTTQIPGYSSRICANATDIFSLTDTAGSLSFYTVPASSTTATRALLLDQTQNATFTQSVTAGTNFALPTTSSSAGQMTINSTPALQEYGTANLFTGGAGNFTLTVGSAVDEVGEGTNALTSLTTGASNTGVGFNAGHSISTGADNTCLGSGACFAGTALTTGSGNTFLGYNSQANSSSAGSSVAIGTSATVASSDVAIGAGSTATGADNTVVGQGSSGTGNYDTLIGQGISNSGSMNAALGVGVSVGSDSVVIGYNAQTYTNSTGAVALGYESNVQSTGGIALGANAYANNRSFVVGNGASSFTDTAAGQIVFGNSNNALNSLFLGSGAVAVAAPSASSINVTPASGTNSAGANLTLAGGNSTGTGAPGSLLFQTATAGSTGSTANTLTTRMDIAAGGNVGIANTAPAALLDVGKPGTTQGVINLDGATSGYTALAASAAAGSWKMTLPTSAGTSGYVLETDGTGVTTWIPAPATGANTTLSNLTSPTSINQNLLSATSNTYNLGSGSNPWLGIYGTTVYTPTIFSSSSITLNASSVIAMGAPTNFGGYNLTNTASITPNTDAMYSIGSSLLGYNAFYLDPSTSSSSGVIEQNGTSLLQTFGDTSTHTNLFLGYNAGNFSLTSGTAIGNTGVGSGALLSLTTGTHNTALGVNALTAETSGLNNTAIGYGTLATLSATAQANVAIGVNGTGSALAGDTTGNGNIAVGGSALLANTSGNDNTALGVNALKALSGAFVSNTAVGYQADLTANSMSDSTAIGATSAASATGATSVGYAASSTATDATAIGYAASSMAPYATAIGYQATANAPNALILGNSSALIGIGTSIPVSPFSVLEAPAITTNFGLMSVGDGVFDGVSSGFFTGGAAGTYLAINQASGESRDFLNFQKNGVQTFYVDSSGNITAVGGFTSTNNAGVNIGTGAINAGTIALAAPQTTLTGSAGTAVCSEPEQGTSYKKVLCYLSGYTDTGTQTYNFSFSFANPPYVYGVTAIVAGTSASPSSVTFTVTTQTGYVFLEGN